MQWELLTSPQFEKAVKEVGVCILPIGVLERHSDHLPLGTDYITAHKLSILAAEKEKAVVYPPYYYGQIYEARCFPGAVNLKPTLLLELLQNVLDEIGRNGFKKIIIYNWHGGNWALLQYFIQSQLYEEKDYTVYLFTENFPYKGKHIKEEALKYVSKYPCHAGEWESSIAMTTCGNVDTDAIPKEPGVPLGRLSDLSGSMTAVSWYADYPTHYDGDARTASKEKGDILTELHADHLAEYIKAVKNNETAAKLQKEFFSKVNEK